MQLDLLVWRQLEQYRPELGAELVGPFHEENQLVSYISQPLDVADEAAGFDRKLKVIGSGVAPTCKRLRGGQPIEGIVELDGPKSLGEIAELVSRPQTWRIGRPLAPMPIYVSGCSDPDLAAPGHPAIYVAASPVRG